MNDLTAKANSTRSTILVSAIISKVSEILQTVQSPTIEGLPLELGETETENLDSGQIKVTIDQILDLINDRLEDLDVKE